MSGLSIRQTMVDEAASQTPRGVTEATRKALFCDSVCVKPQGKESCRTEATAGGNRQRAGGGGRKNLSGVMQTLSGLDGGRTTKGWPGVIELDT